ncbi:alkaline phosphatase family protein [Sphingomonas sp. G-3-2-10]|uniref:alkaline phosphatase family protein n=1 Tax=Sphingomonas sp. G-3-2-10 TaxID=2728838 RepID=UPI001469DA4A|nr:alkaline phosphatase family protein [Sphingomonas sp. G-3-2-10]NML06475.1 alkaline phosphatase family protein [Sphingomonas sp. G-3-2-10]
MKFVRPLAAALALTAAAPLFAQEAPAPAPAPTEAPARQAPPKLVVVISVDQFSADLFAAYRAQFTGGFARLMTGAVFPSGYQSHAATETCPGHSTILTGARPYRTGIVANDWTDFSAPREDKTVYCSEDTSVPGSNSKNYTVSDKNLKVPTLGEWMKAANPASRVVSVAGKDRAAVMMGGHKTDEIWWFWDKTKSFQSYAGRAMPPSVARMNAQVADQLSKPRDAMALPAFCQSRDRAYNLGNVTVGSGRMARKPDDLRGFKASPDFDASIVSLAIDLANDMKLGQGDATDLLIVGASATDYVGHGNGAGGTEMCIQMLALDQTLGRLFTALDATGVDYAVVLTADHGGLDIPERNRDLGATMSERVLPSAHANAVGKQVQTALKLPLQPLTGSSFGDVYFDPRLTKKQHKAVQAETIRIYTALPQVEAVFTRAQIAGTAMPKGPPETWTLLERARASYEPSRSGDLLVVLKPRIMPISSPGPGYAATHGSIWDYDRRVPILFWRKGMTGFEHPLSVETVDIAPSLAGVLGIPVPVEIDGRCLDLDAGPETTCK